MVWQEGKIEFVSNKKPYRFNYLYDITDHLGSVRSVVNKGFTNAVQTNDYYPFGLTHTTVPTSQKIKYLYNGKELQSFGDLDYGARRYDPALGIWRRPDPLAEKYFGYSPYSYCANNPLKYIDPTGMAWIDGSNGVFWDQSINSLKEFEKKYADQQGYSYASDADNAKSYTLSSGAGKLVMNEWTANNKISEGIGIVTIDMSFITTDGNAEVGWTQTFSSNIPDTDTRNYTTVLPDAYVSERLDGVGVQQSFDVSRARYFDGSEGHGTANPGLVDTPVRKMNTGAGYDVTWDAQSTVMVNGSGTVSVGYGFTVTSPTNQQVRAPRILKSTTPFHDDAVQSLSNKIIEQTIINRILSR